MVVAAHSTISQLGELEWGGGMIRIYYESTPLAFKRMKGVSHIKIKTSDFLCIHCMILRMTKCLFVCLFVYLFFSSQIEKLRNSIQTLTRSANPLGKIMDYIQVGNGRNSPLLCVTVAVVVLIIVAGFGLSFFCAILLLFLVMMFL